MALRTVTMSELRLEVLLRAEQSGESTAGRGRRVQDVARDVLPVLTSLSGGRDLSGRRAERGVPRGVGP